MNTKRQAIMPYERPVIREEAQKEANPFRAYVRKQRMRKLKPVIAVLILTGIWYVMVGREIIPDFLCSLGNIKHEKNIDKQYYKAVCSEAGLARMLAVTCSELKLDEQNMDKGGTSEEALWYEKYYKALEKLKVTALQEKNAFQILSYERLDESFRQLFGDSITQMVIRQKEQYQIYEITQYLDEAIKKSGKGEMAYKKLVLLATPDDIDGLKAWQVLTSEGSYYFEGLVLEPLKNKTIICAVCKGQILGIREIKDSACEVKKCRIITVTDEKVTYEVENYQFTYGNKILTKEQEGRVLNLILDKDQVVDFSAYKEETALADDTRQKEAVIRVLLTSEKGDYIFPEFTLTASGSYQIIADGKEEEWTAQKPLTSSDFDWQKINKVRLAPRKDASLTLSHMTKGKGSPSYKGIMEIRKMPEGFAFINETDLEDYVAAVVPSEMPTSYEMEALKAQAVAARTYGASYMGKKSLSEFEADVDDTTRFQVYNRIPADQRSYQATRETFGLVLKSGDKLISNKFFSASCGFTANSGEVWMTQQGKNSYFPGNTPDYLSSQKQFEDNLQPGSMQEETAFRNFISLSEKDLTAYDKGSPWFRWQLTLTKEQLENLILPNLKELCLADDSRVSFENSEGKPCSGNGDIGKVREIEVRKRGEGGNAMILAVAGSKMTALIQTEYAIRRLFASNSQQVLEVTRMDHSKISDLSLLPSAFFVIDEVKEDGRLSKVTLKGGGNGHGVGLSQDGARGMAKMNYTCEEILAHYYKGAQLASTY